MKNAFSMIELVISIVVMGIVVTSLPLILTQTGESNFYSMKQEAILAAKTRMGEILTYDWDDSSYDTTASRAFVLDTTSGNAPRKTGTRRDGHFDITGRRRMTNVATLASTTLGNADTDSTNDIDDFHGDNIQLLVAVGTPGVLDYVFDLNITTTVSYVNDAIGTTNALDPDAPLGAGVTTTNIKMIEVNVTEINAPDEFSTPIVLRAFSSNIGDTAPLKSRPYQ